MTDPAQLEGMLREVQVALVRAEAASKQHQVLTMRYDRIQQQALASSGAQHLHCLVDMATLVPAWWMACQHREHLVGAHAYRCSQDSCNNSR